MTEPSLLGLSQRQPPTNIVAEQALLGAILANNKAYDAVSGFLRREHFADPVNGTIYAAVAQLVDGGRLADVVTLSTALANAAVLEQVGGTPYLAQLLSAMVGVVNAREYGRAVRDCWMRRELIDIGEQMVNSAFGTGDVEPAETVIERAEEALFRLGERGEAGEASSPAHEAMAMAMDAAARARDQPGGLVGLPTGYRELDDITGGWRPGSFIVLGARPSMGKSSLALGIAMGAVMAGASVLFASLEMTRKALGAQLLAGLAPMARDLAVRGKRLGRDASGRFVWHPAEQVDFDRMHATVRDMYQRRMEIDECPARTMASVRSKARRMKRRGGLDLVVIDHLAMMRVPELQRFDNRVLEVTRLSGDAKALARELDVPVLMLAQLNRGVEGRENKRPTMADLRDSGSIEQDADVAAFLYRDEYYLAQEKLRRAPKESEQAYSERVSAHMTALHDARGRAEIIIAKQREGRTGTVQLRFDAETTWFRDVPEADADGGYAATA